ncbi:MAG: hypothetical protein QM658_11695 [Gordonia sp. (in: high G+C Gram-positive bacteria)]
MVGRMERNKDLVQDIVENTAHRVGSIASIITGAVVDVTREIGDLVTDGFEMREASKQAALDKKAPTSSAGAVARETPELDDSLPELVEGSGESASDDDA